MRKKFFLPLVLSSTLFGAGYQIPNNSINSVALATANVANSNGADTSYYNPANMVKNESVSQIELSSSYIILEPIDYEPAGISSKRITSPVPSFHYVSKKSTEYDLRFGLSLISPAGLSREWDDAPASASAKKFSLKTVELNPTMAIPVSPEFSVGFGLRFIAATGEVELDNLPAYSLEMEGDTTAYGYNLALSYNINNNLSLALTYRSEIMLDLDGTSDATLGGTPISSDVSLETPVPANMIIACAYTFESDTTVEVTYDKTFWSAVTETNFEFDNATLEGSLGVSQPKKWHDTVAYRLGVTQKLENATLMAGIAKSDNAAPDQYVSFSSPESDSMTYSLGGRYEVSDKLDVGLAGLLAVNEERTSTGVSGTLSQRNIYTLQLGFAYKF